VELEGPVSEDLVHHLQRPCQQLLRTLIPTLRPARVKASEVSAPGRSEDGLATGFSAGVDSFTVLADHHYPSDVPPRYRVTHLLYNNVGSHGPGDVVFRERYERLKTLPEALGLPYVKVDSNLDSFFSESFQRTHTMRNASVALLLQGGIGRFLYASGLSYRHLHVSPTYDMAYADPILLPLVPTDAVRLLSTGSEYTRVEKTMRIAEVADSYRFLDVCVRTSRNCSRCWKCMRTLLTFEIGGVLERYDRVFDLAVYRRHRELYMAGVLLSSDPLLRELVEFARDREFRFPAGARVRLPLAAVTPPLRRAALRLAPESLKDWLRRRAAGA
jgi:hypothetical protein